MKLKPNQLSHHLKQQGLAPIYLITGSETFLMMECMDTLRNFAHQQGFVERIVLTIETTSDWTHLDEYISSLSLFANKRLLDVRLGNKVPGNEGTKVLMAYMNNPPTDIVLLISADKLEASKQKTKWFTTIDKQGVIIQVWPLNLSELPHWITQRMKRLSLQAPSEAIHIIAERSEGHLLACVQEIEKLRLLYGSGHLDTPQVLEAVADNARFGVFDWVDTVLTGDTRRCVHQLQSLQAEGVEAILIAWALNKEIRNLCHITYELQRGQRQEQVFKDYRIWTTRKDAVLHAIKRYPQPRRWQRFLRDTVPIDRMIKGIEKGNPWDELQRLSLRVAGINLFKE